MRRVARIVAVGACVLTLGGCAREYVREEPHHFSKDARGHRVACYTTDVANEYECVPVYRDYGYAYPRGYYDPYWSTGFLYGWPYGHHHYVVVEPPPANPNPPPPPQHWRPRPKKR